GWKHSQASAPDISYIPAPDRNVSGLHASLPQQSTINAGCRIFDHHCTHHFLVKIDWPHTADNRVSVALPSHGVEGGKEQCAPYVTSPGGLVHANRPEESFGRRIITGEADEMFILNCQPARCWRSADRNVTFTLPEFAKFFPDPGTNKVLL